MADGDRSAADADVHADAAASAERSDREDRTAAGAATGDSRSGDATIAEGDSEIERTSGDESGRSSEAADFAADDDADERRGAGALAETRVRSETVQPTNHWVGVAGLAFAAAGLGVVLRARSLLLAAVVGIGYLAYANALEAPSPSLAVERRLEDSDPEPGDTIRVTVAVENAGDEVLADLRVVDHVPSVLGVVDGPARTATALRPGARMTFSYSVLARRGEFEFDGLTAIARNASGSRERELDLATEPTTLTCLPPIDATTTVPLRSVASPYTGRVPTDSAGEGVEFASVREYQHGDSLSRIDWNRYARGGELSTMEFREERMATVVVLLDLREAVYLQAGAEGAHAADRSIDAAGRILHSLLDTGDRVGLAAFTVEDVWLAPGAGPTHRAKARNLLATHSALSPEPPAESVYLRMQVRHLRKRLPDRAQVVLVSPVPDDQSVYAARALQVAGHPVTVVSPDATRTETTGRTLARIERSNRLNDLRGAGVRVVDWTGEERLAEAIERARRRWSA